MQDLYIRVNRDGIRAALAGDRAAMPISVHDAAGKWIHRTRRLGISLGGSLEVGYMTFDSSLAKAGAAGVYFCVPNAELAGDQVELAVAPAALARLMTADGRLTAEQILALAAGWIPPEK